MTSAGAVAAIDCWLHLLGTDVTNRIAKVLVTHRRTGKVAKLNTLAYRRQNARAVGTTDLPFECSASEAGFRTSLSHFCF